jgi:hypothetical protein
MAWITLAQMLGEGALAAINAIREGTAEAEVKALDALDHVLAEARTHVSALRTLLEQNRLEAEKALHEKFNPEMTPLPDGETPTKA